MAGPKKDNVLHLDPKRAPVFAAEIKRIDVLVLLWWILGVFDRAVGPLVEPVGMLLNVRMIGGAVEREVECDFHSAFAHFRYEPVEIGQRTERRFNRHVSAGFAANCPRHARIPRLAGDGIVAAFAIGLPNGMNRGKVNDIKSHGFRVIDSRQTIAQGRATIAAAFG